MRLGFNAQLGVAVSGKARYSRKPPLYVVPNRKTFYTPIPPILRPRLFFHYLRRRSLICGSRTRSQSQWFLRHRICCLL